MSLPSNVCRCGQSLTRDRNDDGRTSKHILEYIGGRLLFNVQTLQQFVRFRHTWHHHGNDHRWRHRLQQPRFRRLLEGQYQDIGVVSLPESGARRLNLFAACISADIGTCINDIQTRAERIR